MITDDIKQLQPGSYFYLAGPFFNPAQIELIKQLEGTFDSCGVPVFSPRLSHGNEPKPIRTEQEAADVFNANYNAIKDAAAVLAVVDWLTDPGVEIRSVRKCEAEGLPTGPLYHPLFHLTGPRMNKMHPALNIPDTGTVWEMGAAYASGVPTIIYTTAPPIAKMNIMLSRAAVGYVNRLELLAEYLRVLKTLSRKLYPNSDELATANVAARHQHLLQWVSVAQ